MAARTTLAVASLALLVACAAAAAPAAVGAVNALNPETSAALAKVLTSNGVVFIAQFKLLPGVDVDKFIKTREAVIAKSKADLKFPYSVLYVKGAAPKTETLAQGPANLQYYDVAAIASYPTLKDYTAANAWIGKSAEYQATTKQVKEVVRTVNVVS
ncbi:hypothetical protein MNEG_0664 [Monoraphidium neglectum]|uniref:Stress-response A/B barrel domain-containing protein n=1 Tax=Monoraphidium neglectum TaxID=145388 RepID=A0A0D2KAK3_9CHLO|nr:hypothetical protein MNEG_0664 [Monoraphidium neglectum]KIZ07288.1 hypothetical protein MNEG_0664 [Monoraphidium neglectum]|eukprot:XP_013906307.1 hypothetical protein MNEG_0664 [Monoraphidium neglectum]